MIKNLIILLLVIALSITTALTVRNYRMAQDEGDIIYTYEMDGGLHLVIGAGKWGTDGKFHILDVFGQKWSIPQSVTIERSTATRDDIPKQTH